MSPSREKSSPVKAAREVEREILMTMEVVSGDDSSESSSVSTMSEEAPLHDGLCFGPYGITPLSGLHFDCENDTATS